MKVKIHRNHQGQTIVAVCDSELLGQTFEEGEKQIQVSEEFYGGDEKTEQEAGDIIRNANMINLVGEKSVQMGIKEEIIEEENIIRVQGIPYALGYVVRN